MTPVSDGSGTVPQLRPSGGECGAPRYHGGRAVAAVATCEVAVHRVSATRAWQVVREVKFVGLDGVPHGRASSWCRVRASLTPRTASVGFDSRAQLLARRTAKPALVARVTAYSVQIVSRLR
jgi:hypothetical protein